jgi:hypothetical protein
MPLFDDIRIARLVDRYVRSNERERTRLFDELYRDVVTPTIEVILRRKVSLADGGVEMEETTEYVRDLVVERLLAELEKSANDDKPPIRNFRGLVSQLTYQAFGDYLAEKYPVRRNLRTKLWRLLEKAPFARWLNERRNRCGGLAVHRDAPVRTPAIEESPLRFYRETLQRTVPDPSKTASLVYGVYDRIRHPTLIETLVTIIYEIQELKEVELIGESRGDPNATVSLLDTLVDLAPDPAELTRLREVLQQLWQAIGGLPLDERRVLILALKEPGADPAPPPRPDAKPGAGAAAEGVAGPRPGILCESLGIASRAQIAATLEYPWDEYVALEPKLPLSDRQLGELLSITPARVAFLRMRARGRLERALDEGSEASAAVGERAGSTGASTPARSREGVMATVRHG